MFNLDVGNFGGKVGFIFGVIIFIGFFGCWFYFFEIKDCMVNEFDELYMVKIKL